MAKPSGATLYYAADHVFTEMYGTDAFGHDNKFRKLSIASRREGWPTATDAIRAAFEKDYLPIIRFVNVSRVPDPTWSATFCDSDDELTAKLAVHLSSAGPTLYSHDHSSRTPDLAPNDLELAVSARTVADIPTRPCRLSRQAA